MDNETGRRYHYYVTYSYFAESEGKKALGVGSVFVSMPCKVRSDDDVKQLSEIAHRLAGHEHNMVVTNWKYLPGK